MKSLENPKDCNQISELIRCIWVKLCYTSTMADHDCSLSDVGNSRISQPFISLVGKNRLTHEIEKVSGLPDFCPFICLFLYWFILFFIHSIICSLIKRHPDSVILGIEVRRWIKWFFTLSSGTHRNEQLYITM